MTAAVAPQQAWEDGFEAGTHYVASNPGPAGVISAPPRNPQPEMGELVEQLNIERYIRVLDGWALVLRWDFPGNRREQIENMRAAEPRTTYRLVSRWVSAPMVVEG